MAKFGLDTNNYSTWEDYEQHQEEQKKAEKEQQQKEHIFNTNAVPYINDVFKLNDLFNVPELPGYPAKYQDKSWVDVEVPRGADDYANQVKEGIKRISLVNKIHVIKLNGVPADETEIKNSQYIGNYMAKSAADLCMVSKGMVTYDIEDFLYCKWVGVPINRLITLRRFPVPVIDNIYTINIKNKKGESSKINDVGDVARMVTYMTAETNKMDDILSISYALKWKQLTAEFDQMSSFGEQSGISGWVKNIGAVFDKTTNSNYVSGRATGGPMASYDPKFDQNRVYGPVDSIAETHIRDVGLEFNKEFEITFDYELRSINGRTPEYAMKDVLANVIACTFNSGKFWPGARYWVGERPSPWAKKLQWMNSGNIDTVMKGMMNTLATTLKKAFGSTESALNTLKKAVKGGFALAMSKLLDGLGRPGIPAMQSLLSSDPVGEWHLMVGNPHNPIMSIGNLMCTGTDIKFPTDALGYGDFPTKMQVIVKLKPGMPKDATGVEMMFNHGTSRMYWQPTKQDIIRQSTNTFAIARTGKVINSDQTDLDISRQLQAAYDFIPYTKEDPTEAEVEAGLSIKNPNITVNGKDATLTTEMYDRYTARDADGNEVKDVEKKADDVKKDDKKGSDKKDDKKPATPTVPSGTDVKVS